MQTELLKAPEDRAGSLGADSAKDTIMYIVGGIKYMLFVLRGDTLPLDLRRDAAHCVLDKGPRGRRRWETPGGAGDVRQRGAGL